MGQARQSRGARAPIGVGLAPPGCGGAPLGTQARFRHTARMRRTVLIDDNNRFRATARRVLEAAGYEVVAEAADGESGVVAVREAKPDLALIDVQLPDIDGFEVTRRLVESGSSSAIVLISSRDRSDFGNLVDASGARGFVPKAELSAESLAALL
jgi:DNA-binding NarL/FixJ family response regulator